MRSQVTDSVLRRRLLADGYRPSGETHIEVTDVSLSELAFALGLPPPTSEMEGIDAGLGFVHKKIGKIFKKVGRWVKKQGRKINWKKVLKIGVPLIAGAALLVFAGVPLLTLGKMVGTKGALLMKKGAVFAVKVVSKTGKLTVALVTKKEKAALKKLGVSGLVAIALSKYRSVARAAGVSNPDGRIMDDWTVAGNEIQFAPGVIPPSELKADGGGILGGKTLLVVGAGGALLFFALRRK